MRFRPTLIALILVVSTCGGEVSGDETVTSGTAATETTDHRADRGRNNRPEHGSTLGLGQDCDARQSRCGRRSVFRTSE